MEFGDIIYFLLIVVFMILGFFNDYRKRRRRQQEKAASAPYDDFQRQVENQKKADDLDDWWNAKPVPPPVAVKAPPAYVRRDFQSSIGSAASYEGQSSLEKSAFAQGANFKNFYEKRRQGQTATTVHPLLRDLLSDSGTEELRKGLIYREILQRKY